MKRALVLWMGLWWLLAACQPSPGATPQEPTLPPPTPTLQADRAAPATATPSPEATSSPAPATPTAAAPSQDLWGLPDPNTARWVRVAEGFRQPTAIVAAPGYPGRLFILERQGVAWTLWQGERQVFLDLRDRVGSEATEQGLLGMAFHPDFPETPWVFVNYTDKQGDTVVARFPVDVQTWTADPGQERVLLQVDQPYGNHNGGHLLFGPDGYLYIGLGDGGAAGDPQDNAQNPQTLLGKMLRIDVNAEPYGIPPDNAFPQGGGRPEIWAMGLRNPWRYDFDPLTGDLYIADVGQDAWEEVNFWPAGAGAGANFGWDYYEASFPFEDTPPPGMTFIFPVAEYPIRELGCAVTGGVVYRGRALGPEWQGVYLYGDFCSGRIWGLRRQPDGTWANGLLYETPFNISTFGRDAAGFGPDVGGEVYLAHYTAGEIYRLEPAP